MQWPKVPGTDVITCWGLHMLGETDDSGEGKRTLGSDPTFIGWECGLCVCVTVVPLFTCSSLIVTATLHMHTHARTRVHMHTHAHTDVHTYTHEHMYTQTCTHLHTYTHAHTCTYTDCTHVYICTHIRTCTHVPTHTVYIYNVVLQRRKLRLRHSHFP